MYRWSDTRLRAILMAAVLLCLGGGVAARTVLDLDVQRQPVALADWGDAWVDPTGRADLNAVLKMGIPAMRPTHAGLYSLGPGRVLWIRFTVPPAPDQERWYIKLPNAGLDRVTLFTRTDHGWTFQAAGDHIPVANWPLPHLYPLLPIALSAADATQYALRIEASNDFSTPIQFVSESGLSSEQQRISLLHGMYFGLLGMVAIFALATAAVMRDAAYVWFSLFAAAINLSVATSVGVAGLHLWPNSPVWADAAEYDKTAQQLVRQFIDNFAQFADHVDEGVRKAAPVATDQEKSADTIVPAPKRTKSAATKPDKSADRGADAAPSAANEAPAPKARPKAKAKIWCPRQMPKTGTRPNSPRTESMASIT